MKKLILDVSTVFRNFRKCFGASLEQARQNYHIPKSQFLDSASAEKESSASSPLKVGEVLRSFFSCLSNAIEDARQSSHLPKSRFREMTEESGVVPEICLSGVLDESLFDNLLVEKAKLDGSVLPGAGDGDIGLSEVGFEGTIAEELGGRAWDEPSSTD